MALMINPKTEVLHMSFNENTLITVSTCISTHLNRTQAGKENDLSPAPGLYYPNKIWYIWSGSSGIPIAIPG